jgi:hypothetical protein
MDRGSIRPRRFSTCHDSLGSGARRRDHFRNLGLLDAGESARLLCHAAQLDGAAKLVDDHDEVHQHIWFHRTLADTRRLLSEASATTTAADAGHEGGTVSPAGARTTHGAQLLAQQPQEVQEAVNQHQQDSAWQVYKAPRRDLYPYDEGQEPEVDCAPLEKIIFRISSSSVCGVNGSGKAVFSLWQTGSPAGISAPRNRDACTDVRRRKRGSPCRRRKCASLA